MSRIDKANPKVGNYRANLAAALPANLVEHAVAVGHDAQGRVVIGGGQTGIKGILVLTKVEPAGKRIDVFTNGEVIEFGPNYTATNPIGSASAGVDLGVAGTNYYGHPDGKVDATKGADGVLLGHTVENYRLVLRVQGAGA